MSALGAALVMTTTAETMTAANFRSAQEGVYAADAALELVIADIARAPDWTPVLDGTIDSTLLREFPDASRTLADGSPLDPARIVNVLNCRDASGCDSASLVATSMRRPWGANNPVWRLHAYAPLSRLLPDAGVDSAQYVVVVVADDPSENDGDPRQDGRAETNPGRGIIVIRAEAFGPRGARQVVEAVVANDRPDPPTGVRVLSWRLLR